MAQPNTGYQCESYHAPPGYPYWQHPAVPYWATHPAYHVPQYAPYNAPYYWQPRPGTIPQPSTRSTFEAPEATQQRPKLKSKRSLRRLFEKLKTTDEPPPVPPIPYPNTTFYVKRPVEICDATPRSSIDFASYYKTNFEQHIRPLSPLLQVSNHSENSPRSSTSKGSGSGSTSGSATSESFTSRSVTFDSATSGSRSGSASGSATSGYRSGSASGSTTSCPRKYTPVPVSTAGLQDGSTFTPSPAKSTSHKRTPSNFRILHKNTSSPPSFSLPIIPPIPPKSAFRQVNNSEERKPMGPRLRTSEEQDKKHALAQLKKPADELVLTKTSHYPIDMEADLYVPEEVYRSRPKKETRIPNAKSSVAKTSLRRVKSLKDFKDAIYVVRPHSPPPMPAF